MDVAPSAFGIELSSIDDAGGLQETLQAGVRWVRFGTFNWDEIEPHRTDPPTYYWDGVGEASLIRAVENGLDIIATIRFAPEWAQMYPGHFCGPFERDAFGAYAQFLQALVSRYSVPPYNVRYWELGNEPDIDHSLVGGHNIHGCWGDYEDEYYGGGYYAEMLKVAYPAIKAADPSAQVLMGGVLLDCDGRDPNACAGGIHKDVPPRFLEGILRNGGGPYFDIVSFHAYGYYWDDAPSKMGNGGWPGATTTVPDKVGFLREVLERYGFGDKPLMNTEAALLCKEATPECRETQAAYVPRAYAEAIALGLEAQVYFAMFNDHWWNTGLLQFDRAPRPAYQAFKTASSFLGAVAYQGEATAYPAGTEGYVFLRGDGSGYVDVIWSTDGSLVDITLPSGAEAYDLYGKVVASSGSIQVHYTPAYITRP